MVQDVEKAIKISDGYSPPQNTFIHFIHNHINWFLHTDGYKAFILREREREREKSKCSLVLNSAPCYEEARWSCR